MGSGKGYAPALVEVLLEVGGAVGHRAAEADEDREHDGLGQGEGEGEGVRVRVRVSG